MYNFKEGRTSFWFNNVLKKLGFYTKPRLEMYNRWSRTYYSLHNKKLMWIGGFAPIYSSELPAPTLRQLWGLIFTTEKDVKEYDRRYRESMRKAVEQCKETKS